jgi:molecular chaperone DnaK
MVKDAEANAEADRKFEQLVTARNSLEGLIHATKKTLEEAGDKATADEQAAIQAALSEAESVVKSDDKEKIEASTQKLTEASSSLAQKLYAEQQASANAAGGAQQAGGTSNEEGAFDAEFEEVKEDK